ncbi:MAG: glycoside hydrolase, partial [Acidobacteria bacterium]|nr:glycoside hydrolase [Acidobacteriota bacterium]
MTKSISRRDALQRFTAAGAGALLATPLIAQETSLRVTGRAVELALTPISTQTIRLTIAPLENGKAQPVPMDGSLTLSNSLKPTTRLTTLARERSVRCGSLKVTLLPEPLTIRIAASDGRLVQELRVDQQTGALSFLTGENPILGFGEGGPQFDRRGETYTNRNGQGGYRLRTHGGRVPIQWLI